MFSVNALNLTLILLALILTVWGTVVSSQAISSYHMKRYGEHRAVMIISNIWGKVSHPFNPVVLSLACTLNSSPGRFKNYWCQVGLELKHQFFLGLESLALGLELHHLLSWFLGLWTWTGTYVISFPGSPPGWPQILELLSLHNHGSQLHIMSFFFFLSFPIYTHTYTSCWFYYSGKPWLTYWQMEQLGFWE